ncbi:MAG: hypothetical protein ACYTCN_00365 [Planctomycetota bacterium]|jgi:hypothetical protein
MNENHKNEIEELLSDLVDEQAGDRQKTEFKRLVAHDPGLIDQLAAMQRQRDILNALPVESAPDSLADDITAMLERKLILGDTPAQKKTIAGTSHLFLRRVLTTAAMLLLPLGLLFFVVFEIMRPPSVGPGVYVPTGEKLAQSRLESPAPLSAEHQSKLPFDGVLAFRTERLMAVSNFIEEQIFDQGLLSFPNRTADTTSYQLTASPVQVQELVTAIEKVWPHCQGVSLSVSDETAGDTITIPLVQAKQVAALAAEDSTPMLCRLAEQYATANRNRQTLFAQQAPTGLPDIGPGIYPRLPKPVLTARSDSLPKPEVSEGPVVRLQIHIQRIDGGTDVEN